jgi:hypothetical protein
MVNLDDHLDEPDTAADFQAMKDALKALADAVASTNLAVIHAAQGDAAAATQRVQASVAALSRFNDAYTVLDAEHEDEDDADED